MKTTWRTRAAIIIERTICERKYHPYKIWCDEIRRQLGQKRSRLRITADEQERRGQQTLFKEVR